VLLGVSVLAGMSVGMFVGVLLGTSVGVFVETVIQVLNLFCGSLGASI
jgi:hypothetical protein